MFTASYNPWYHLEFHQVAEPLRAMVMGAPLEDARHLAQRYDKVRQEAEAQVILLESLKERLYCI